MLPVGEGGINDVFLELHARIAGIEASMKEQDRMIARCKELTESMLRFGQSDHDLTRGFLHQMDSNLAIIFQVGESRIKQEYLELQAALAGIQARVAIQARAEIQARMTEQKSPELTELYDACSFIFNVVVDVAAFITYGCCVQDIAELKSGIAECERLFLKYPSLREADIDIVLSNFHLFEPEPGAVFHRRSPPSRAEPDIRLHGAHHIPTDSSSR